MSRRESGDAFDIEWRGTVAVFLAEYTVGSLQLLVRATASKEENDGRVCQRAMVFFTEYTIEMIDTTSIKVTTIPHASNVKSRYVAALSRQQY